MPLPPAGHPGLWPRRAVFALAAAALSLLGCSDPERPFELTVLHTNDVHSRFLEFERFGNACRPRESEEGQCFGGAARRATLVEQIRGEVPHTLLLDAGDQFQGTLFYSRFKGTAASRVMNHMAYDAMVVGNHEFDDGPATLATFAAEIDFPLLATNVDWSAEPALEGLLVRSAVLERGGRRIGLVGYITEETPSLSSPGPNLAFEPIGERLQAAIAELEGDGVDVILALSHAGMGRDLEIARTVAGIDLVIGGHTNTLLHNDDENAEGPYPTWVEGPQGNRVPVITAFAWGMYLGRIDLTFDGDGVLTSAVGHPILLDGSVEPDETTAHLIEPLAEEVASFSGELVGAAAVELRGDERTCRFGECALGNLIADALLAEGRASGAEVALHNSGSIRSTIPAGAISIGQVLEVLPFGNTMSTFGLRGDDLRAVLEHSVSRAEDPNNDGTGRFLQVAGVRFAFDLDQPAGARVDHVEVRGDDGSYEPLDPERVYRVVANSFNRSGGDDYTVLRDRAIDAYDQGRLLSEVVTDHIRRTSPVAPEVEGRVRLAR